MGAFLDYIFQNNHYREVQQAFDLVHSSSLQNAFDVWQKNKGLALEDNYTDKELIFEHIEEIKTLDKWIRTTHWLMSKMNKGVEWLYCVNRGMKSIPAMNYKEYEFIMNNEYKIKTYDRYNSTYSKLLSSNREAIQWLYYDTYGVDNIPNCSYKEIEFIATNETKIREFQELLNECNRIIRSYREASERLVNKKYNTFTFADKKKIANSEKQIKEIDEELKRIKKLRETYPLAWQKFSNGKNWDNLTLAKLKTADKRMFKIKDAFLKYWDMNPELVKLILGVKKHPITSFDDAEIEKEQSVLDYMENNIIGEYTPFSKNVHLDISNELKRAILDSDDYGKGCHFFPESNTISSFYLLRKDFDRIGVSFDTSVKKINDNFPAIYAYNKERTGNDYEYYTSDYLDIVTEGHPLNIFVEEYKNEKDNRDKAKELQRCLNLGFKALYDEINLEVCPLSDIIKIINSEELIRAKNEGLENIERRRREEEEKKKVIGELKLCVSTWPYPNRSSINCFSMYYYYPTKCGWEASEEEWAVRNLIWDFKANSHSNKPDEEIKRRQQRAKHKVFCDMRMCLEVFFREKINKLTFVCIPGSTKEISDKRYKSFSELVSRELCMDNGYNFVTILKDGISKNSPSNNTGKSIPAVCSLDSSFFRGRYVLLFDDVITTGESMERFKNLLETVGAYVIGGFSIGKTRHERQSQNPIDTIRE